tara:strand:- start:236 stop:436 length:201 start_codon:yes stop_codon:yes gene_type:complete
METLYTNQSNGKKTFSGECEPKKDVVMIDEFKDFEELPFGSVSKELNKDLLFLGFVGLTQFVTSLN